MSTSRPYVYVSSPLGFTEFGRQALRELHLALQEAGLQVRDPWDWPGQGDPAVKIKTADLLWTARIAGHGHDWNVSQEIAARNVTELRASHAVLAVLDGSDVDSGVAAEVGYASAIGKPVVGIRTDERGTTDSPGHVVNLQVAHLIDHSCARGGRITRTIPEAIEALCTLISSDHG